MSINDKIISKLQYQLELEITARDTYQNFLGKISDELVSTRLEHIIKDEEKHISIVKEMIRLVEEYGKPVQEAPGAKSGKPDVFDDANAVLMIANVEDYAHKLMLVLEELVKTKKIVYLSYNKIPKYTKKLISRHEMDLEKFTFINISQVESVGDVNINPEEITRLSIVLKEVLAGSENLVVVIDTITGFSTYHGENTIKQFVGAVNNDARVLDYNVLWVAINNPQEKSLNSSLSQVCDETLSV